MKTKFVAFRILLSAWLFVVGAVYLTPASGQSSALIRPYTMADITGTGAAVRIQTSGTARWVEIVAQAGNAANVRFGDSAVTAARGIPIVPGAGQFLPFIPPRTGMNASNLYDLSSIYVYVASGDKVSVIWAQ